jgi:hypothetical protein
MAISQSADRQPEAEDDPFTETVKPIMIPFPRHLMQG